MCMIRYRVIIITSACLYVASLEVVVVEMESLKIHTVHGTVSHLELSLLGKAGIAIPTSEACFIPVCVYQN